ncbi:MAG TPA: hypothetical protein VL443_22115 [Cyclobacteriaceae bacterium]|jgi:hypothetical protein|nr:hypothetical protein [Cyclobacteriaceae bacterium]
MKTCISLLFAISFSTIAFGKVLTVSNNPDHPAQFPDVQAAITAASSGDTIYVHGSQFTYPDFTINKKLVVIGAGYNSNNQFNQPTRVGTIYFIKDTGLQDGSSSTLTGFLITSNVYGCGTSSGQLGISNVKFFRNQVNGTFYLHNVCCFPTATGSNWTIYNNLINIITSGSGGSTSQSASNITMQNNIIFDNINGFSMSSVLIDHNVFPGSDALSNLYYATVSNNIFMMTTGNILAANVNFNTFNKNLSMLTTVGPNAPTNSFAGGSNTESGNFIGVDPKFVNVTNLNSYSYSFDYRLSASSTVRNVGTDGTDLGIYGGAFPYPSGGASGSGYDTSPLPPIPQVTEVNILNATLQPGSSLNVNVKAKVNN